MSCCHVVMAVMLSGIYTMIFFGLMIFHWDLHALIHPSGGEVGLQPSQHQRDDRKMSTEGMTCLDDVSDHFSMVMLKIAFTSSQQKGCNLCVGSYFIGSHMVMGC